MTKIPSQDSYLNLQPGIYLAEVSSAQEKRSNAAGELMWSLTLKAVDYNARLCFENLMMEGKGGSISSAKLSVLGFKPGAEHEATDTIGRRAYVCVASTTWDGKAQLKVDIKAPGSQCGYWPENAPPAGVLKPPPITVDDPAIPF